MVSCNVFLGGLEFGVDGRSTWALPERLEAAGRGHGLLRDPSGGLLSNRRCTARPPRSVPDGGAEDIRSWHSATPAPTSRAHAGDIWGPRPAPSHSSVPPRGTGCASVRASHSPEALRASFPPKASDACSVGLERESPSTSLAQEPDSRIDAPSISRSPCNAHFDPQQDPSSGAGNCRGALLADSHAWDGTLSTYKPRTYPS